MSLTESFDVADISNPQPGQVYVERMAETVGPLPAGRLVALRDLDKLALNRAMNSCNSLRFSSILPFLDSSWRIAAAETFTPSPLGMR